ncbi:MAG: DUF4870 domain-containing protein [Planctomycetota bacterium]
MPPPTPPQAPVAKDPQQEAQQWALFCHLGAFVGGLILPLVLWLVKKDDHPFIDEQGKEAVNFQLTVLIGILISVPLCLVIVGFFFLIIITILNMVFSVLAAIAASKGEHYRYPVCIRFIK